MLLKYLNSLVFILSPQTHNFFAVGKIEETSKSSFMNQPKINFSAVVNKQCVVFIASFYSHLRKLLTAL